MPAAQQWQRAVPTHVAGHLQVLHFCHGRNRVLDCIPWQGDVAPALDVGLVLVILAPQFLHLRARRQSGWGASRGLLCIPVHGRFAEQDAAALHA